MTWRLAWRLQRFEMALLIGLCLLVAAVSMLIAWQLGSAREELVACYRTAPDSAAVNWPCAPIDGWASTLSAVGSVLAGVVTVAPFVVGLFLGAPLVAREIERRTAPMAWSLSTSRRRWLGGRAIPVAVIVAAALLILGQAGEVLALAMSPDGLGFPHFGTHGPLVAARGLAVLAIGVVVGVLIGRTLPAVLVTGVAIVGLMLGITLLRGTLIEAEAVWIGQGEQTALDSVIFDSGFRSDTTGEVITWETAYEQYPDSFMTEDEYVPGTDPADETPPGMSPVWRTVRAEQYPWFVAREAVLLVVVAIVAALLATALVVSRRPD